VRREDKDMTPIITEFGRLLDVRDVANLLGVHPRTIWQMASAGSIPQPIHLSPRVVRWRLSDIEDHVQKLAS
jgi:predicted DNA-binding transcriptional regulator AlpA